MKNILKWASTVFVITLLFAGSARANGNNNSNYYPPSSEITYQQFYNDLSPYGNWINDPQYGYVWSPYESGFHPYRSNGNWAYTRYGWTWVSGYRWGWAPFHYGRWTLDPYYGWLWIPGYQWAPAWVDWRGGGDYYGWAPMGPGYGFNVSINIWNFVPRRYIYSRRLHNYYVNPSRNVIIINNTTIINNKNVTVNNGNSGPRRTYNTGPSVREVEQATKTKVRQLDVVQSSRPGAASIDAKAVRMYKPEVEKTDNKSLTIRPVKAIELNPVQRKEVLAARNSSLEKSDSKSVLNNSTSGATRSLNEGNRNLNANSKSESGNTFQDNGIKNSSGTRVQLNNDRSELNMKILPKEVNTSSENPSGSRNLNPVIRDKAARNFDMDNQVAPVQEKSLRTMREIPSAKRELPQARQEAPATQPVKSRDVPVSSMAPEREPVQTREAPVRRMAPERQPVQTREEPPRRVAPAREAPARQERVRSLPSREQAPSRSADSPRRIRRG